MPASGFGDSGAAWGRSPGYVVAGAPARFPLYPRLGAVINCRAAAVCRSHKLEPLALWLRPSGIRSVGVDIHPDAPTGGGAKVLGPVTTGDTAWIGANAVVPADEHASAVATGIWHKDAPGVTS